MSADQECAVCGAVYRNANLHQRWHNEIDEWIDAIQVDFEQRLKRNRSRELRK